MLALLVLAGPASAQDAPRRDPRPRALLREELVLLLNPLGAQHRLDFGVRHETGDPHDLWTSGSHVEGGIVTAVAPVFAVGGVFLQAQPLSFLMLRAEVVGVGIWPVGLDAAGHFALSGYDAEVRAENLPASEARTATGWLGTASATLKGAIDLDPRWRLLIESLWGLTRVAIGTAAFYYSMRHDLVVAREDFIASEYTFLGAEGRVVSDLFVRFGVYDDLRLVPASGYVGHQLGAIAIVEWIELSHEVSSLALFVRGGAYSHHVIRTGDFTILVGCAIDYELGRL